MSDLLRNYLKPGRHPWSEEYQNSPRADNPDTCIVCGKYAGANGIGVILTEGGDTLVEPADDDKEARTSGYMGHWIVGPECGSKIPAKYRTN